MDHIQVIVVGAGPSGIGVATALKDFGVEDVLIMEGSERIGGSFVSWPAEMRLITPSFNHNAHGMMDLNSIVLGTAPSLGPFDTEHLSGLEYSEYLEYCVELNQLRVALDVGVLEVHPLSEFKQTSKKSKKGRKGKANETNQATGFQLETTAGTYSCDFVVWAAGEFQYPAEGPFEGSDLCKHNSEVESWKDVEGSEHIVIGGYESGVDATVNLLSCDKAVTLIGRRASWAQRLADPSLELAPYTRQRLRHARNSNPDKVRLAGNREVYQVTKDDQGMFTVHTRPAYGTKSRPGRPTDAGVVVMEEQDSSEVEVPWELTCSNPPILANGFQGSVAVLIKHLFRWTEPGGPCGTSDPMLSVDCDESTLTPGLFLCGPQVRHEGVVFCFIFKFRQRFAIVANAIAERIGLDPEKTQQVVDRYREAQMFLDDLECCKHHACGPAC